MAVDSFDGAADNNYDDPRTAGEKEVHGEEDHDADSWDFDGASEGSSAGVGSACRL